MPIRAILTHKLLLTLNMNYLFENMLTVKALTPMCEFMKKLEHDMLYAYSFIVLFCRSVD